MLAIQCYLEGKIIEKQLKDENGGKWEVELRQRYLTYTTTVANQPVGHIICF